MSVSLNYQVGELSIVPSSYQEIRMVNRAIEKNKITVCGQERLMPRAECEAKIGLKNRFVKPLRAACAVRIEDLSGPAIEKVIAISGKMIQFEFSGWVESTKF